MVPIPTDRPRSHRWTFRGRQETTAIGDEVVAQVESLAKREQVPLSLVLLGAFQTLLHRYSGIDDIVTLCPRALGALEPAPPPGGPADFLPLRTDFSGAPTFRALLATIRDSFREASEHCVALDRLTKEIGIIQKAGDPPVFPVKFAMREKVADDPGEDFEISLTVSGAAKGLGCLLSFNAELYEPERIRRMLEHYLVLLRAVTADPGLPVSTAPLLGETERRRLLVEWNDTHAEYPRTCVHQLFEAQVERTPNAVAVIRDQQQVTYRTLNATANQIARYLRSLRIGPGAMVGICVDRSVEMIACLLAILKTGAGYVPLDPSLPVERLRFMTQDAQLSALLCSRRLAKAFQEHPAGLVIIENLPEITASLDKNDLLLPVNPDEAAYLLYTSGSTGQPKGVLVSHDSLVNYLSWCATAYRDQGCGSPLHTSIGFDLTITSLFPSLLAGLAVVLVPEDRGVENLAAALHARDFSLVKLTPSHLDGLRDAFAEQTRMGARAFVIGGEALHGETLGFWRKQNPHVRLFNEYGPTEATVGCCVYEVPPGDPPAGPVPIGRPIANTRLYVLDRNLQLVPIGTPGELYIGGRGVARGYYRRPELTAERFIADPFSTDSRARLYKTGDLVRYQPDGNLQFLGRLDNQIKVRGFRIELSEIETTLLENAEVRDAVVCAHGTAGNRRLIAYISANSTDASLEADLRSFLSSKLPDYMLPSAYVFLKSFPLTTNGKVDRRALAALDPKRETPSKETRAPQSAMESRLLAMWQDILETSSIGLQDNFFDLGGQSLSAARLIARIAKEFKQTLPLGALFQAPTIKQLAALLREGAPSRHLRVWPIQPAGSKPPFFCVGAGPLFRALANALGPDQPFLGLVGPDFGNLPGSGRLEDLAMQLSSAVRETHPEGPCFLGGWSDSGILAYEVARQLQQQGRTVGLLVLFDSENEGSGSKLAGLDAIRARLDFFWQWGRINWELLRNSERKEVIRRFREGFEFRTAWIREELSTLRYAGRHDSSPSTTPAPQSLRRLVAAYRPQPYDGPLLLFQRSARPKGVYHDPHFGWGSLCRHLEILEVPGDHKDMFLEPTVRILAQKLSARLARSTAA